MNGKNGQIASRFVLPCFPSLPWTSMIQSSPPEQGVLTSYSTRIPPGPGSPWNPSDGPYPRAWRRDFVYGSRSRFWGWFAFRERLVSHPRRPHRPYCAGSLPLSFFLETQGKRPHPTHHRNHPRLARKLKMTRWSTGFSRRPRSFIRDQRSPQHQFADCGCGAMALLFLSGRSPGC